MLTAEMFRRLQGFFHWMRMNLKKKKLQGTKENPCPLDPSPTSSMFFDEENNKVVATFKGAITYSLYKDNNLYGFISSILATKPYKPPILSEDRRSNLLKKPRMVPSLQVKRR